MAWGLFCLEYLPLLDGARSRGLSVVPLGTLLREPLMNGAFKKPENAGRGTRLVNVFDLYGERLSIWIAWIGLNFLLKT